MGTEPKPLSERLEPELEPELDLEFEKELDASAAPVFTPRLNAKPPKTTHPREILVCADCNEYREKRPDWRVCPKCGEELIEVEYGD